MMLVQDWLRMWLYSWQDWLKKPTSYVFGLRDEVQLKGRPHLHGTVTELPDAEGYYTVVTSKKIVEYWDEVEPWCSVCSTGWRYRPNHRRFTRRFPLPFTLATMQAYISVTTLLIDLALYQEMKLEIVAADQRAKACETTNGK